MDKGSCRSICERTRAKHSAFVQRDVIFSSKFGSGIVVFASFLPSTNSHSPSRSTSLPWHSCCVLSLRNSVALLLCFTHGWRGKASFVVNFVGPNAGLQS
eukprot:15366185-Ditylum_brightwellii.AAC.1